ncbi:hypothetical protein I6A60_01595 [Frankia sp. AgB1.9]|uniref:hypothetical protein n=1 Tax=unclassified Frankia TaxID=2632575 RepID=UPI0019341258|nr:MULTISPECIES: hypothetical protein [unclassified Frankia]MBL7490558.1 hypothetical protein [Frankia sp. AgW1.1]MBL7546580.1 hypothetical protein [Frankia sp. AgB1.9]MBL7622963.1 hypothetical protein [Frankia sp. AgB1.8]
MAHGFDPDRNDDPADTGRPVSVWPYPPDTVGREPAGWLQAAVQRLVVATTRPGDPVLVLIPPAPSGPATWPGDDTGDELAETDRTIARLGRPVQVRTAPAHPAPRRTETGPGPDPAPGHGPAENRYRLVVTVLDPTRLDWVHHIDWDRLLTTGGTLAVITRSDSLSGWLIDPTVDLTAATGRHKLLLLDRFVLLEVPLDELDGPSTPSLRGRTARRVHADLLLFTTITSEGQGR